MASPNSLKRTCEVAQLDSPSLQQRPQKSSQTDEVATRVGEVPRSQQDASTAIPTPERSRAPSAAPSTGDSSTRGGSVPPASCVAINPGSHSKRRKLTFAEKEVQRLEKQFKDQQRAAEKARKDEEKKKRESEKKAKDDEKAKKEKASGPKLCIYIIC